MAHGYSTDLRERAVGYVHRGGTREEACEIFLVGSSTLDRWLRQYRITGNLRSKPNGSRAWKFDHGAIVEYVASHSDSTLHEIAQHFGTVVSVIDYVLRKFNITRKKNDAVRRAR
jgi:transposase